MSDVTQSTKTMPYDGFVIKNNYGQYFCSNNNSDWWFDEALRFACIYETAPEAQEEIDLLKDTIKLPESLTIQHVKFDVVESGINQ